MASEDTNIVLVNEIINQLKFFFVKIKIANQKASKSACHDMDATQCHIYYEHEWRKKGSAPYTTINLFVKMTWYITLLHMYNEYKRAYWFWSYYENKPPLFPLSHLTCCTVLACTQGKTFLDLHYDATSTNLLFPPPPPLPHCCTWSPAQHVSHACLVLLSYRFV